MSSVKTTTRTQTTLRHWYWHVRLCNAKGESPASHKGWVVCIDEREILNPSRKPGRPKERSEAEIVKKSHELAVRKVKSLVIDNGPDGEWAAYPEFTVDVLEFDSIGVAELY